MEDFVVSARKYRPETFDTVVGQQGITTTLKNAIKNGHLAQAFLFCGPRGVGKTTCARILARTINCMNPGEDLEPCGECESCRGFKNNASQNIYELDAASNRSVDAMRTLVEQVRIPPQVGRYKVYIIDEVHMLTPEAFNAFLKTLEEPPAYAKFILATTEKNKIIPTILSRCQIFDFKRIGVEDIVNHLKSICQKENVTAEEEALRVIAQKADGGLRDALSMFDQLVSFSGNSLTYKQVIGMLNILDYETYFEMFGHFLQGKVPSALNLFNRTLDNGFDAHVFVGGLSDHLRSLLLMQDAQTVGLLETSQALQQRYREQSVHCSLAQLLQALELCNACDLQYRESNNKRLLVEMLLLQLIRVFAPDSLGARGGEAPASASGEQPAQPRKEAEPGRISASDPSEKPSVEPAAKPREAPAPIRLQNYQQPVGSTAGPQAMPAQSNPQPDKAQAETLPAPPPLQTARPLNPLSQNLRSMSSLKSMAAEPAAEQPQPKAEPRNKPVSEADLNRVWNGYIARIQEKSPNLYAILSSADVKLEEGGRIRLTVSNASMQGVLEKEAPAILRTLRIELENSEIDFHYQVDENKPTVARPYTPSEKYMKMVQENPEIRNFKESLHLELEF